MRNPVTPAGFVCHGSPGSRRTDRNPGLFTVKTETKVHLDRRVGVPIAWPLNLAAHVLGKVLRRNHGTTVANVRTVVFAKYVGMGSIIQATPLLRTLGQRFPQVRLTFVTLKSNRNLVERLEGVDEVLCLARHAAVTHPTYPTPKTAIFIAFLLEWTRRLILE